MQTLENCSEHLTACLNSANIGAWQWNIQTNKLLCSEKIAPLLGLPHGIEGTTYKYFLSAIYPADRKMVVSAIKNCIESSQDYNIEHRIVCPDGRIRWLQEKGDVIRDENGIAIQMLGIVIDITNRKLLEQKKLSSEHKYQLLFELSQDPMWIIFEGKFIVANKSSADIMGYDTPAELIIAHPSELSPEYQEDGQSSFEKAENMMAIAFQNGYHHFEWVHKSKSGKNFPVEVSLTRIPFFEKEGLFCVWRDISERKLAEKKLHLSSRVFSGTNEGIIITDNEKKIIDVNPAFCKITGYSRDEAIGDELNFLSSGSHSPEFYASMWQKIKETGYWKGEIWNRKKSGEPYAESLSITTLLDTNQKITNYIGIFTDNTQSVEEHEKNRIMANYDLLTGLPNRSLLRDRYEQVCARSKRFNSQFALCFLDLDGFKHVNDTYGHELGDKLLIQVAERIVACVRAIDTVSRQGGDEFVLLFNNIESTQSLNDTLIRIHNSLAEPYLIDDLTIKVSASSGAVICFSESENDLDSNLKLADKAMYKSKKAGRNTYRIS